MAAGDAYIDFHARFDDKALEPEVKRAATAAEHSLDEVGQNWGEHISQSMARDIEGHGPDLAKSAEHAFAGKTVYLKGVKYKVDRLGFLHDIEGLFAGKFENAIDDAFKKAGRPGGPVDTFGKGVSKSIGDAVGSGFNIPGNSPLILALIPLIGAAAQALNGLFAIIAALPALLGSIGLQVGVLMIAFHGMGTAITKAFSAQNADQLNAALKGLTPSAQAFVKSLLPLKDIFKSIQNIVQENLFAGIGNSINFAVTRLAPILESPAFADMARAMGELFRGLGIFFGSPVFLRFVSDIIPATTTWLRGFSLSFLNFMRSLIAMADASIPFLQHLGIIVENAFKRFGDWLDKQVQSGQFQDWLDNMETTIQDIVDLLFSASKFVASFLDALDKAGGNKFITQLSDAFDQLAFFFSTDAGKTALQGLIDLIVILAYAVVGLVEDIGLLLAGFHAILYFLEHLGGAVVFVFSLIWDAISKFFGAGPAKIVAFFADLPDSLYRLGLRAGYTLMDGLLGGIRGAGEAVGHAVGGVVNKIAAQLPHSPAKEGPFSGQGYTYFRGQKMMQDFGKGIHAGMLDVNKTLSMDLSNSFRATGGASYTLGEGAVQVNNYGQLPTETQARSIGQAAGNGVMDQIAARNVRLAVRAM